MSNNLSKRDNEVKKNRIKNLSGWDKAINDARQTISRLELAITTYEQRKSEGEPWPGDEKAGMTEAIPA